MRKVAFFVMEAIFGALSSKRGSTRFPRISQDSTSDDMTFASVRLTSFAPGEGLKFSS